MKRSRLISILFATAALSFVAVPVFAQDYQNTEVKISQDKTRFAGKLCYLHVVLERQTLFSITKAYNVTVDEIYECNPSLDLKNKGLKAGQILYIPVKKDSSSTTADSKKDSQPQKEPKVEQKKEPKAEPQKEPKVEQKKESKAEPQKEPKEGKSVSDVTSKIDSKIKDIFNKPEQEDASRQDRTKAEEKAPAAEKATANASGDYMFHRVKWFEDLDAIATSYKVSKASIMNINGMTSEKLSPKQMIKIPRDPAAWENVATARTYEPSVEIPESDEISDDPEPEAAPEDTDEESDDLFDSFGKRKNVRITMLIPYSSKGSNQQMMDFYCGALSAARNLGKSGINIDLEADDVAGGAVNVTSERLARTDFILGPVSNQDILHTVDKNPGKAWIVSPLDPKAEAVADTVANVIQAPVPVNVQINDMAKWILEDTKEGDKVIVIVPKGATTSYGTEMLKAINATGVSFSTLSFNVVEGRSIMNSLSGMIASEGTTRVVIASDNKPFVMEAVRNIFLVTSSRKADVQLYGTAKLRSFEGSDGIDIEQLHSINTHISGGYFIDYNDKAVKDFVLKYRALYNAEPSQSAFQGYDMMYFFATLCHEYGRKWDVRSEGEILHGLQSDLKLRQVGRGGYINTAIRRVVYEPDFTIRFVK